MQLVRPSSAEANPIRVELRAALISARG